MKNFFNFHFNWETDGQTSGEREGEAEAQLAKGIEHDGKKPGKAGANLLTSDLPGSSKFSPAQGGWLDYFSRERVTIRLSSFILILWTTMII